MTQGVRDRRAVLAGAGAAILLPVGSVLGDPTTPLPPRSTDVRQTVTPGRTLALHLAVPGRGRGRHVAVLVAHDLDGLDARARAAADYAAMLGLVGCAPDLLSKAGGTPADARAARIMTEMLSPDEALADLAATARWLGRNPPGERVLTGRVAAIGLGWGAELVERLADALDTPLVAAVAIGGRMDAATSPLPMLRLQAQDDAEWATAAAFLQEHLR